MRESVHLCSISRRAHLLPHHRGSLCNSSTTSPKLTTSLAALSLRSSPPPPPAPPCTKRHHLPPPAPMLKALCQDADDLLPLAPTTTNLTPPPPAFTSPASFKRRVNFANTTQVDGIISPTQSQNRSPDETEGVVKIKPAIKKADVKDADAAVNGKRPMDRCQKFKRVLPPHGESVIGRRPDFSPIAVDRRSRGLYRDR
ncbi:hypothetical protein TSMEX_000533 [Taenia solium]|eukprot:TsM_000614300 transcript=TsM_000614300 gene=TsM_000614300